jgi:hypothetical protein
MSKLLDATLLSVCLAAASSAIAQTAPISAAPAFGQAHRTAERAFSRPTERVEARLAYVKTAIKITEAQQSLWDAYAALVRKNTQDMEQRFKTMHADDSAHANHLRPNAIERLERAQSFHAEAVTRINQLLAVEKPLYAALSPEQQKVADVVLSPRSRAMHGPQGRGGHRRNQ